ncbi:MAG: hypothetical protein ACI9S9_003721, partial [Planctomycetota bacterium]
MRADLLPSVTADLLRQSLEHLASPTVVVSGPTADTTIVIANAAARDFGFTEDACPEQRLAELLRPPQDELELATGAMRNHHAVLLRWTHPDGQLITFRVNPLEPGEGHQLSVATWTQQSPSLPPANGTSTGGVARCGFAHTQRDLHDWLARTP